MAGGGRVQVTTGPLPLSNATLQLIEMKEMQDTPIFVHIGVVECSVGRVKTRSGWSIVDRSSEWTQTVFIPEDVEDNEGNL